MDVVLINLQKSSTTGELSLSSEGNPILKQHPKAGTGPRNLPTRLARSQPRNSHAFESFTETHRSIHLQCTLNHVRNEKKQLLLHSNVDLFAFRLQTGTRRWQQRVQKRRLFAIS